MTKTIIELSLVAILFPCGVTRSTETSFRCLPAEIKLDNSVVVEEAKPNVRTSQMKATVKMRLAQLGARCKRGKLMAANGREIHFYILVGCWGNPPENYQEQLDQQAAEILRLKRKYIVIQIPCGQGVDLRRIS